MIGFSQGGAAAAMVAALLEGSRREDGFAAQRARNASALEFPLEWRDVQAEPLRFAVSYSGFKAPSEAYAGFFEPRIATRLLVVLGSLDTIVDERWSRALMDVCEEGRAHVVFHPGGHFVPTSKDMVGVLTGFVRDCCLDGGEEKREGGVEDMDVPF